jgi:hypothetical protein
LNITILPTGTLPPSHPNKITTKINKKKLISCKTLLLYNIFELSINGNRNNTSIEKSIATAPPILLGIDFKIA